MNTNLIANVNYMISFFVGLLSKESVNFIQNGGLQDDYPLSRSLFYMILSVIGLGAITFMLSNSLRDRLGYLEQLAMESETNFARIPRPDSPQKKN
jgi:hypothetical protein